MAAWPRPRVSSCGDTGLPHAHMRVIEGESVRRSTTGCTFGHTVVTGALTPAVKCALLLAGDPIA